MTTLKSLMMVSTPLVGGASLALAPPLAAKHRQLVERRAILRCKIAYPAPLRLELVAITEHDTTNVHDVGKPHP